MILTDNELEEFKKSNTFKMLVKGSYLGVMEKEFENMNKKKLVEECFKKEAQIFDLKDQLALTEKALELACEKCLSFPCSDYCSSNADCEDCYYKREFTPENFKTKAKEMMKSE